MNEVRNVISSRSNLEVSWVGLKVYGTHTNLLSRDHRRGRGRLPLAAGRGGGAGGDTEGLVDTIVSQNIGV